MMICDYCSTEITIPVESTSVGLINPLDNKTALRLDLHHECLEPFITEAQKIKGHRPTKP